MTLLLSSLAPFTDYIYLLLQLFGITSVDLLGLLQFLGTSREQSGTGNTSPGKYLRENLSRELPTSGKTSPGDYLPPGKPLPGTTYLREQPLRGTTSPGNFLTSGKPSPGNNLSREQPTSGKTSPRNYLPGSTPGKTCPGNYPGKVIPGRGRSFLVKVVPRGRPQRSFPAKVVAGQG